MRWTMGTNCVVRIVVDAVVPASGMLRTRLKGDRQGDRMSKSDGQMSTLSHMVRMVVGVVLLDVAVACCGLPLASSSASAQAVSLSDLEGSTIEVSAVHSEKFIKGGMQRDGETHTSGHITIGAGGTLTVGVQTTSTGPWGTRVGGTRSGTFTIGKPGKGPQGNDVVWVFANGELRRLTVHHTGGAGGNMMTIGFRRAADGLHCSFSLRMARENGVGAIDKDAAVDGTPIQILEFKPISSSCHVDKR
jgi:hypothetical protein